MLHQIFLLGESKWTVWAGELLGSRITLLQMAGQSTAVLVPTPAVSADVTRIHLLAQRARVC
jgi:hypothetical protein